MTEKRSGKRRKILRILIGVLLVMAVVICCLNFGEKQIQRMMKKRLCAKVIKYEEELLETVKACPSRTKLRDSEVDEDDNTTYHEIYYKDLEDENVNRVFKTFRLWRISNWRDEGISFDVNPTNISIFWDYHNYFYGFYYTENDEPVDMVWGTEVEETEFEYTVVSLGRYWYRTEKITDNWWYYEYKWLWFYPVGR